MRTLADRQHEKAKADADDRDLESRSDRRRQQDTRETMLKSLAERLVGLKPAALERLALDEELMQAIATAQAIRSAPARNRQVNVVRQHLRALGAELDAMSRRLDGPSRATSEPSATSAPPAAQASPEALRWLDRLAADGDDALTALLAEHPHADRQLLRQSVRELGRVRAAAHAPSVARVEARLCELLDALLGN